MDDELTSMAPALRALANENRLQILAWILDPRAHFPRQRDGDLVEDGVCVGFITDKIGLSQPTVTAHMRVLADAGLVSVSKRGRTRYCRLEASPMKQATDWLKTYERFWAEQFSALARHLEADQNTSQRE